MTAAAWSGDAAALLERAIGRHGGWTAWQALRCVSLAPRRLRGLVPSLKGYGRTFTLTHGLEIARERHVVARLGRAMTPFVALHAELEVV